MGSFSIWHWLVVLLVIILLFGAKKIPELAKGLGSGIKNFKKAIKEDEEEEEAIIAIQAVEEKPKKVNAQKKPRATKINQTAKKTAKKTARRKTSASKDS